MCLNQYVLTAIFFPCFPYPDVLVTVVAQNKGTPLETPLSVFTSTPEGVYGASHVLLSKEHCLNTQGVYKVRHNYQMYNVKFRILRRLFMRLDSFVQGEKISYNYN